MTPVCCPATLGWSRVTPSCNSLAKPLTSLLSSPTTCGPHMHTGTIIRRREAEEGEAPLAELVKPGDRALLAVGGRGGRGNESFKTARNNAPTIAERGEAGERREAG